MTPATVPNQLRAFRTWIQEDTPRTRRHAQAQEAFRIVQALASNPLSLTGALIVVSLIVLSVFAPLLTIYSPLETDLTNRLQPTSGAHWLGTDDLGSRHFLSHSPWDSAHPLYRGAGCSNRRTSRPHHRCHSRLSRRDNRNHPDADYRHFSSLPQTHIGACFRCSHGGRAQ